MALEYSVLALEKLHVLRSLATYEPPRTMPTGFDDHKRTLQFLLIVLRQHSLKLRMYGTQSRRQHAEIKDSRPNSLHEDEPTEIAVARDEESPLPLSRPQQLSVLCAGKAERRRCNDIMT
jgi:hypothetical protein